MLSPDPRFDVIDAMTGKDFELALVELFECGGAERIERIGGFDKGADLVVEFGGERIAVQAKRHSGPVRIGAVRQLLDGMTRYDCSRGLVVTNSFFTQPAIECADAHGIELWDRRKLAEFVDGEPPNVDTGICAECGIAVTPGVTDWCLKHPARYGGRVLCIPHQRHQQP